MQAKENYLVNLRFDRVWISKKTLAFTISPEVMYWMQLSKTAADS